MTERKREIRERKIESNIKRVKKEERRKEQNEEELRGEEKRKEIFTPHQRKKEPRGSESHTHADIIFCA